MDTTPPPDDAPRTRRGHGRPTMAQVADAAGVTKITVSRYLSEPARVAPETAARIVAALRSTGYVPNKQAGMLASGRSRMVAAIVPNLVNSVFAETVQGLSDGLQAAGCELLLAASNYSMEREEEQVRAVLGWSPLALVVTGRHHTDAARAMLRVARDAGTPIIEVWDRQPRGAEFVQVGFDHAAVGRAMARHLLDAGRKRLAYVDSGVAEDYRAHERGAAFAAVAKTARVLTAPPGDAFDAGRAALGALLGRNGRPLVDAIAFANDHLACGALLEAQRRGLTVPQDVALLGFGDFAIGRQLGCGISSVRPPRYEIGAEAARFILRIMAADAQTATSAPIERRDLPWLLVTRGSTRRAPA